MDFRTIKTEERDAVLDLLADWHNDREFFARYFRHEPSFRDDLCFVAVDRGHIVSTLQVFRKVVRAGGGTLQVAAVGNVFTAADYREQHLASALLERALLAMDEHKFDVSLLFAVRLDFYGRFGWRSHPRHLTYIEPSPVGDHGPYELTAFELRDLAEVMRVYDAFNRDVAATVVRDHAYWLGHLNYAGAPAEDFTVARHGDEIVAYARGAHLSDYLGYYVILEHACLPGHEEAAAQLLCRLHAQHAPALPGTIAQLATSPVIAEHLHARAITMRTIEDIFWMWRVISPERVAAKLARSPQEVTADDFFARLFRPEASVYWIGDRF